MRAVRQKCAGAEFGEALVVGGSWGLVWNSCSMRLTIPTPTFSSSAEHSGLGCTLRHPSHGLRFRAHIDMHALQVDDTATSPYFIARIQRL